MREIRGTLNPGHVTLQKHLKELGFVIMLDIRAPHELKETSVHDLTIRYMLVKCGEKLILND